MASTDNTLPPADTFGPAGWTKTSPHPFDVFDLDGDWDEGIKQIGYEMWSQIGGQEEYPRIPMVMNILVQQELGNGLPNFLLEVHGNGAGDRYLYVFAENLPSLMALLAQWGPAVQGATLAHLASYLPHDRKGLMALLGQIGEQGLDRAVDRAAEKVANKVDDVSRTVDRVGDDLKRELSNISSAIG